MKDIYKRTGGRRTVGQGRELVGSAFMEGGMDTPASIV